MEPYTAQEYQERKEMREKLGLHFLESIPEKGDLDQLIRKGMTSTEIEKVLGKAYMKFDSLDEDRNFHWHYSLAPEKRPENPHQKVNQADLKALLSMSQLVGLAKNIDGEEGAKGADKLFLSTDCDLMRALAQHFPEVKELCKKADKGKVSGGALNDALSPYQTGDQPLPKTEQLKK